MNYEEFKNIVTTTFADFMPEQYRNLELIVGKTQKVNCTVDSITFNGIAGETNVSPVIYISDMYDSYKESGDLESTLKRFAMIVERAIEEVNKMNPLNNFDFERPDQNIAFQLVNTAQNREWLANNPHREWHDLSIIYRWVVKCENDEIQSIKITTELAEKFGFSEEQLYDLAMENTKKIFPPVVKSMKDVLKEMFLKDGMPEEMVEDMFAGSPSNICMWVINNESGVNGAGTILYEEILHNLSETLDDNLFILPSSVHEVIAIPASESEVSELSDMVMEVNMGQVALEERLSNEVYHYDRTERKVTLASDVTNKSLENPNEYMQEEIAANTCKRKSR